MKNDKRNMLPLLYRITAVSLACVYFGFQVEVFEDEYEKNNPLPNSVPTFTYSSFNWESFDKTNAPRAFAFVAATRIALLCYVPEPAGDVLPARAPFMVIRDKSPPEKIRNYELGITNYQEVVNFDKSIKL
jgi:hypothetical protein